MNDDAPKLRCLSRGLQFHILKKALGMSNTEIAKALGKPYKTVEGWSGGVKGKQPPESAIEGMKALLAEKIEMSQRLLDEL